MNDWGANWAQQNYPNSNYGGAPVGGPVGFGGNVNAGGGQIPKTAGTNLGMGSINPNAAAPTNDVFANTKASSVNYYGGNPNAGGGQAPQVAGNPYVQPGNPNQAQEIASAQGNINSQGVTEAQARAQFGDAAVQNALAKGVTFSNQSAVASAPNTRFLGNNDGQVNPTMSEYQKNPYLDQMAAGITQQMNDNWSRNLAPSIRSGAMAAGGFGGSRQGVVEANGLNDLNKTLGQSLTSLYGQDYTNDRNRALQKYSADQGYNLGMANNNLGFANLDSNNAQFGQNLALNTLNSQYNWAQGGVNNANAIQNQPINYFNGFNNNANVTGGHGGTTNSTTGSSSDPLLGTAALLNAGGNLYDKLSKKTYTIDV
jgi:hypothetical protein